MRVRILSLLAVVGLLAAPSSALAVTIDFSGLATGGYFSYIEDGYQFNYIGFGDIQEGTDLGGGNIAITDIGPENPFGAEVVVSRVDAQAFTVTSFDYGNLTGQPCFYAQCVSVGGVGFNATAGGTFAVNWLTNITSFTINIISSDLTNFGLPGGDFWVDNIVIESAADAPAVPEPGTIALMLTGLAVLGRKRIAARLRRS